VLSLLAAWWRPRRWMMARRSLLDYKCDSLPLVGVGGAKWESKTLCKEGIAFPKCILLLDSVLDLEDKKRSIRRRATLTFFKKRTVSQDSIA
jgi:hypothetical protein